MSSWLTESWVGGRWIIGLLHFKIVFIYMCENLGAWGSECSWQKVHMEVREQFVLVESLLLCVCLREGIQISNEKDALNWWCSPWPQDACLPIVSPINSSCTTHPLVLCITLLCFCFCCCVVLCFSCRIKCLAKTVLWLFSLNLNLCKVESFRSLTVVLYFTYSWNLCVL